MSDTTSTRHRKAALALLTAPATAKEADKRLTEANQRLLALDEAHRVSHRKSLRITSEVLAEVRAVRAFASGLASEDSDKAATLHIEADRVWFSALHLRHLAIRNR